MLNLIEGIPLPMLPLHMILTNLGTELYPALVFAFQKADGNITRRPSHVKSLPPPNFEQRKAEFLAISRQGALKDASTSA